MIVPTLRPMRIGFPARRLHLAVACWLMLTAVPAFAHPHVWVTMKEELLYAPDGTLTGVRHAWTFGVPWSAFRTQRLSAKTKGHCTRGALQSRAQTNIESLQECRYCSYAVVDGKKQKNL